MTLNCHQLDEQGHNSGMMRWFLDSIKVGSTMQLSRQLREESSNEWIEGSQLYPNRQR